MRSCAACMSTSTRPCVVLREHVDAVQLREREAQRMRRRPPATPADRACARRTAALDGDGSRNERAYAAAALRDRATRRLGADRQRARRDERDRSAPTRQAASAALASERARRRAWKHELVHARAQSRKRTSLFAGCTFTSTGAGRSRGTARRRDGGRGAARPRRPRASRARATCRARSGRSRRGTARRAMRARSGAPGEPVQRAAPALARRPRARASRSPRRAARRALARAPAGCRCDATRPLCVSVNAHVRARQRDARERFVAAAELGRLALQELAARRRVEVQVLDRRRVVPGAQRRGLERGGRRRLARAIAPGVRLAARRASRARARATDAIEASASPRKPSVATRSRSSSVAILLVARRASASGRSSRAMPTPSSATRMRLTPPSSSVDRDRASRRRRGCSPAAPSRGRGPLDHLAGGDLVDEQLGQRLDRRDRCSPSVEQIARPARIDAVVRFRV